MKQKSVFLVFLVLCLSNFCVKGHQDGQNAYDAVLEKNRGHFISLHLALGLLEIDENLLETKIDLPQDILIPEDAFDEIKEVKVPNNFSTDLYLWTKITFDLTTGEVYEMLTTGQTCKPNTTCLKTLDIGSLCCPF